MTQPLAVLHVCTGNIGRSPMAEFAMRADLNKRYPQLADSLVVASAGTWGCEGAPMEPFALSALSAQGLDVHGIGADAFRARELTVGMLQAADVVLTATVEHRAHVVGMLPSLVRRTFTLREFARIAVSRDVASAEPTVGRLRDHALAAIDRASRLRGLTPRGEAGSDDIEDPIGAPETVYLQRADEIRDGCFQALDLLVGVRH